MKKKTNIIFEETITEMLNGRGKKQDDVVVALCCASVTLDEKLEAVVDCCRSYPGVDFRWYPNSHIFLASDDHVGVARTLSRSFEI